METRWRAGLDDLTNLEGAAVAVLSTHDERELLVVLSDCKRKLAEALEQVRGAEVFDLSGGDDPIALAHSIAAHYAGNGSEEARLGAVVRRYHETRGKLALANLRLVAHVAKRFRDRGIAYADLLQEGFCGLLEAIDRFDLHHGTKLATYATWWIRQAMQRAVASGAYPVRLSPRHLRQLAATRTSLTCRSPSREARMRQPVIPRRMLRPRSFSGYTPRPVRPSRSTPPLTLRRASA